MTALRHVVVCAALAWPAATLASDIAVQDPFAVISPAGQSGAAFMRLDNTGAQDDRLVAAASDIAARVELHTHVEDSGGVMRMVEVEDGFALPAGGSHVLERGGDHVMFLGLTRAPEEGERVTVVLTFESGTELAIDIPVVAMGGPAEGQPHSPAHGHSHGHSHGHAHDQPARQGD